MLRLDSYPDKLIEFVGSKKKVSYIFVRQYHRLNEVNINVNDENLHNVNIPPMFSYGNLSDFIFSKIF